MIFWVLFFGLLSPDFVQAEPRLTLVYSNDVYGEVEPCGCRNNPLGGLIRRSEFVRALAQESNLIQVDSGDLLFSTTPVPPALAEQSELQASYVVRAMNEDGLDAAVPGERDFGLGVGVFERLKVKAKYSYLGANITWKSSRGKIGTLKPSIVIERAGKRVCLIGLVGKDLSWPTEVKVSSPIEAARTEVAKLKARPANQSCDWIVALSHQGGDLDLELTRKVPGIDFVFSGHSAAFLQTPVREKNTWLFEGWFRNQYLGSLVLTGVDFRKAVGDNRELPEKTHRLTALDPGLEPVVTPSPAMQTRMQTLVTEFREKLLVLVTRQEAELRAEAHQATATEKKYFQTFPQCAECHLKQFDFWRQTRHARAFHALFKTGDDRNRECLSCHTVGFAHKEGWKEIGKLAVVVAPSPSPLPSQAVAMTGLTSTPIVVENGVEREHLDRFLEAMSDADDIDAKIEPIPAPHLSAEVANAKLPLRAAINRVSRAWTPVQCENCHAPGQEHPFTGKYSKAVSDDACLKCHNPERAQDWYAGPKATRPTAELLAAKRAMVSCPAGDLEEKE